MKGKEYTLDQIRLLETQLGVKSVLKKYDLICVSNVSFSIIQAILAKMVLKHCYSRY